MRRLRNWALFIFIFSFLVIIAGAVVRTTQSGMGCPDWPRCFGKWIPPTDASQLPPDFEKYLRKQDIDHTFNAYHTWIEYINRLLGMLLGVFAVIQVFLFFRKRRQYPAAYKRAMAYLVIVILTGLFGALVVKYNLAHASVTVHLFFALLLLQVQLSLLLALRSSPQVPVTGKEKNMLLVLFGLLIVQIILGTNVRIFIDGISKALNYQYRSTWLDDPTTVFYIHRTFSILLLVAAFLNFSFLKTKPGLSKAAAGLLLVLLLTAGSGAVLNYLGMPAAAQPVHLLLASVALTQAFYLLWSTGRLQPGHVNN